MISTISAPLAGGGYGGGGEVSVTLFALGASDQVPHPGNRLPGPLGSGIGSGKGTGVGLGAGSGSGLEGSDPILAEIRARIERAKRYPLLAQKMKMEGKALVHFQIDPSGRPFEISLKQSSHHPLLDDEALATVRRATPFPLYKNSLEVWISFMVQP